MSHLNLSSTYNGRSNSIRHMSVWKGTAPPPLSPSSLLYPTWCGRASMSSVSASVCNIRSLSFTRRRLPLSFFNIFCRHVIWTSVKPDPTVVWHCTISARPTAVRVSLSEWSCASDGFKREPNSCVNPPALLCVGPQLFVCVGCILQLHVMQKPLIGSEKHNCDRLAQARFFLQYCYNSTYWDLLCLAQWFSRGVPQPFEHKNYYTTFNTQINFLKIRKLVKVSLRTHTRTQSK